MRHSIIDDATAQAKRLRDYVQLQLMAVRDIKRLFYGADNRPSREALRWLERLAAANFVNKTTFHEDPREQAFREGKRALALEIIASVKLDPMRLQHLIEQTEDYDHE